MTSTSARPARRSRAPLAITAAIIAALVIAFFIFAGFYADVLWYDQLGYLGVLLTQWGAGIALFFIGFLAMAIPVFVSIQVAYRSRPVYAKLNSQLDRYQQVIEPLRRLAMFAIPAVFGLFAGVSASSGWQRTLLWLNRTPSGTVDPQFQLDTSFYMFELPFYHAVVGFASAVVIISMLGVLATSYLYGAVRFTGREVRISKSSRIQIAVTAGVYFLLQGVSIWLDQYSSVVNNANGGLFTGAAYSDVNAVIPGRAILAGIAGVVALFFIVTAVIGRWRLPIIGTAGLIVASILVGTAYPAIVQRFQVEPNERALESQYYERNIEATRQAYGLADIEEIPYDATTDTTPGALREDAATTANIRILDPAVVGDAFSQLQQFRQYYQFGDNLDVDRYQIDGRVQDTVVAVRELSPTNTGTSWVNQHLVYTHGYSLVAAYGTQRTSDGQPVFLESGIPASGDLGDFEPRVYFGENSPDYSIVGGPESGDKVELDYPSGVDGADETYTTFQGDGGPKVDNVFKRLIYALKFQSEQIFLANQINDQSQIIYDRDPAERVGKVAPYLTIDKDPYPSVVDGRVVWIVDGYTTSDQYPYSQRQDMSRLIADSQQTQPLVPTDQINYIRNSVKATVDAYDGKVTLYAWDTDDPILKTWQKVFPSTLKPISDISGELMSHLRFPADMFKVQRAVLGKYHVTDPGSIYSNQDLWTTPNDPTATTEAGTPASLQPPYYLTMQMPGQDAPRFSLYSTFIPPATQDTSRSVLTGYLGVDSDAGSTAGEKAADYGKLRLLTLPNDDTIPAPTQIQNNFNSDTNVANQLNLLERGGRTSVVRGNLLTLPVGGGLLYVQPVYVRSTGDTSYPLLRKVLVAFGDKIAFEDTLDAALDSIFEGDSGATAGDEDVVPTTPVDGGTGDGATDGATDGGTGSTPTPAPTTSPSAPAQDVQAALDAANTALQERQAAYASGDLVAAAQADQRFTEAVQRAYELSQQK
ncbi:UPF0182 family membrane protein [Clavibacter michiganensis]|uniref:UPF0182 family membrane protein n=1 Tax=Clavibacter michiganensis TaxID=28447 RepID=UPI003EBA29FC